MKKLLLLAIVALTSIAATAQTMCVESGGATYAFTADNDDMTYQQTEDGDYTLTVQGKTFNVNDITQITIDDETTFTANTVQVVYDETTAHVLVAGDIAPYITATVKGAHVSITQADNLAKEITYDLSGSTDDGEFYMTGSYKATVNLRGLTLTNTTPVFSGAAICIMNGKRIDLSVKSGTLNTLADAANGDQKAALYCKGHLELKGKGILNVYGNAAHAIKSGEYTSMQNCTINVLAAVKDGLSVNEYFLLESGSLTISGTGDDGIQVDIDGKTSTGEKKNHEEEDSGNVYLLDGTLKINVTADAAKGIKAAGDVKMQGGKLNVTQTGSLLVDGDDLSYPTCVKSDGNIAITGGTITIINTADGGKGISADGTITIDESKAKVNIDITANGKGGTAELTSTSDPEIPAGSYKVYVSIPTGGQGGPGGGNSAWRSVYLYKNDGTLVQQLTSTVTKSSGYSTMTFYYYDFKAADEDTYYFKSDNYTSRNTTYTIQSSTFCGPTSGTDVYYSITNSYQTSGSTRTYSLTNVTSTYSGTSDVSDEDGTSYNAMGIKADGDLTISAGTITVKNSGEMSKSLKSKAVLTINGGDITLTPSGAMKVINSDASYSTGIKAVDFVMNDGTVTITASGTAGKGVSTTTITTNGGTLNITDSGAPVASNNGDYYTAKGMKADGNMSLNAGTITIKMTGNGGKGIKVNGKYTEGTTDGEGPTLIVSTTGSAAGSSSQGGGGWGGPGGPGGGGMGGGLSGTSKGIKVMGAIVIYGGTTEITTKTDGAEGLESKTSIDIQGGKHYMKCYDDCINSSGAIVFNGGVTVCYSNGNDAIDSNYGRQGAITIGDGAAFAYTTRGAPEEGFDCDNNSYIQITGTGIGISAGGSQGGGWGGSSSSISNATQGYNFITSTLKYEAGNYYTLSDEEGNNLVTYSFEDSLSSSLALFTAKGMVKDSKYYVKYTDSETEPTDATTAWHGLYLGSTHQGTTELTSFTAK